MATDITFTVHSTDPITDEAGYLRPESELTRDDCWQESCRNTQSGFVKLHQRIAARVGAESGLDLRITKTTHGGLGMHGKVQSTGRLVVVIPNS